MNELFRVAITGDSFKDGKPVYPSFELKVLSDVEGMEVVPLEENLPVLASHQVVGIHGVIVLSTRVQSESLENSDDLLVLSRFGVGYDSVDVAACTESDVVLCITVGAVDR